MSLVFKRQSQYLGVLLTENSLFNTESSGLQNEANSSLAKNSTRNELIGIRRIARVYSKSLFQWGDMSSLRSLFRSYRSKIEEERLVPHDILDENWKLLAQEGWDSITNDGDKVVNLDKNNQVNVDHESKPLLKPTGSPRVVVIKNIPPGIGINSILSQVYGGPLERLVYHSLSHAPWVELSFIKPEHAQLFYSYATKSPLIVNGHNLTVQIADETNTDSIGNTHPAISNYLLHEINNYGSRRCLLFSKPLPGKITNLRKLHYPDPRTHLSKDLDIKSIKQDFGHFGEIISINPVISKNLAFSLVF